MLTNELTKYTNTNINEKEENKIKPNKQHKIITIKFFFVVLGKAL